MKQQHTQQPKLRFPEFEGDWKLYRLENLFQQFKSGNTITSKSIYEEGTYPVFGGNGLRGYTDIYTHEGKFFLIGRQGALCGNINRFEGKAFVSEHAIVCISNDENNTDFLSQRLDYLNLNKLSESSAQPGLAVNKLLRLKLVVPSLPEQQKIADYLSTIDTKINLLEEKKAQLALYKKAMMQKLFSQEIRFKDDNGNDFSKWEEKRLGEIGEIVTGKTPDTTNKSLWNGNIQFITPSDLNDEVKYIDFTERTVVKLDKMKVLPMNTIVFTCIASIGKMALTKMNSITNQQINSLLPVNQINDFIYYALLNITPYIKSTQANTTLPIINKTEFSKFKINIPSLPEQQKIADFLSAIDESIEKVNEQITQTQSFKKAMLQQMFV